MKRHNIPSILFLLFVLLSFNASTAHAQFDSPINWLTLDEAVELSKEKPKKFFIMVYGDDCEWSHQMDKNTYNHKQIAEYVNRNYYPVKFNMDEKNTITIQEKEYGWVRKSGASYHEFTAYITMGRMSTPTIVFLDESYRLLQPIAGYKGPEELSLILKYYTQNLHQQISWSKFIRLQNTRN